jgi:L-asparagine oxygenase
LQSYRPDTPTHDIATEVGEILIARGYEAIQTLSPKPASEAPLNTYSGMYGMDHFPLHTDLAHVRNTPRYLLLRCITGHRAVQTLLLDSFHLLRLVNCDVLSRSLVRPRRPHQGELPLLRLLRPIDEGRFAFRWDMRFIEPANSAGLIGMQKTSEALSLLAPFEISLCNRGDTLILDNWRMLHGRSNVQPVASGRRLERSYLEILH